MADIVVTVPKHLWSSWLDEGEVPGAPREGFDYHFWFYGGLPTIEPGERVYIVAHGKLRGYAPLVEIEQSCRLRPAAHCLLRRGGAVAVTLYNGALIERVDGFRGYRYRWWDREIERPFPHWRKP